MRKQPLERANYVSFATFRKNGAEVRTPVWFAADGAVIYLFSSGEAGKIKRLRNSSRARVAPCNVRGDVCGDWQDAEAHIIDDASERQRAERALARKYGWQFAVLDFFAVLFGRKKTRAYIAVRLSESKGSA